MDYEKDSIPSFIVGDDAYSVRNRLYGAHPINQGD